METNQRKEPSKLAQTPNPSSDEPGKLSIALELLDTIVKNGRTTTADTVGIVTSK